MLSKSKGQVLRLSAAFHVLFCDTDIDLSEEGVEIKVEVFQPKLLTVLLWPHKILWILVASMLHLLLEETTLMTR